MVAGDMEAPEIWVWVETSEGEVASVSLELIGAARGLAAAAGGAWRVAAVLMGPNIGDLAQTVGGHGADVLYAGEHASLRWTETQARPLADLARKKQPVVVLGGATETGRVVMAQAAAELETGLTADCVALEIDDKAVLKATVPCFGGNLMATIVCEKARPQMATVRPGVFKAHAVRGGSRVETMNFDFGSLASKLRVIDFEEGAAPAVRLEEASCIVAGGRGVGGAEGLELVERLAEELGGVVGATRPPVDEGWISHHHQIGQTGKVVSPRLYVACGISGQMQHVVGIQDAEVIVAINKDPDAPIFNHADFGLVGDVKEIVPVLIEKLHAAATNARTATTAERE